MSLEVITTPEVTRNWFQEHIRNNNDKNFKINKIKKAKIPAKHDISESVICGVENCGKSYCNKFVLRDHIAKVHKATKERTKKKSDAEKNHKCDQPGCSAAFNRPYRLKNHKLSVHQGQKPFKCDFEDCDKSYSNESHLARHKNKCHLLETDTNFEGLICENEGCGLVFANKHSLKKHLSTSHTVFPFSCKDCGENFKRKSHLHVHKVKTHNDDAPYKCKQCPRSFIHFHLYNKHVKNHKTYKCDCDMTFDRWSKLLKHKKSDCTIKKKNRKCVICDKVFSQSYHLTLHVQMVHIPDSQAILFKCPYLNCGKSYKYHKNLKDHIRFYHEKCFKRIKCTEENCDVVLKSNKNLKQHIRIVHSGLQPKIRKPRKPRKDKGLPKKSMASVISGFDVPTEENLKNISGENKDLNIITEREISKLLEIARECQKSTKTNTEPLAYENSQVSTEKNKNNGISDPARRDETNFTGNEDKSSSKIEEFKEVCVGVVLKKIVAFGQLIGIFDFSEFNDSIKINNIETM